MPPLNEMFVGVCKKWGLLGVWNKLILEPKQYGWTKLCGMIIID